MADAPAQTILLVRLQAVGDRLAPEKMAGAYRVLVPPVRLFSDELNPPAHEPIGRDLCPRVLGPPERGSDDR